MSTAYMPIEEAAISIRQWVVRIRATRSVSAVRIAVSEAIESAESLLDRLYNAEGFAGRESVQKACLWFIEQLHTVTPYKETDGLKQRLFAFVQSYLIPVVRGNEPQIQPAMLGASA